MSTIRLDPFDSRGELAEIREDAASDAIEAEWERREAGRGGRLHYWERMVVDTTPGVGLDPDGRMNYSTLTPIFSDVSGNRRYGGAS